jgi:hypothetical protein
VSPAPAGTTGTFILEPAPGLLVRLFVPPEFLLTPRDIRICTPFTSFAHLGLAESIMSKG